MNARIKKIILAITSVIVVMCLIEAVSMSIDAHARKCLPMTRRLYRPLISTQNWSPVWQDNNHLLYRDGDRTGQLYITSLEGLVDKLRYIDDPDMAGHLLNGSPDGSLLSFWYEDANVLRLVDLRDEQEKLFSFDNRVRGIAWNPSDLTQVIFTDEKSTFLWDTSMDLDSVREIKDYRVYPTWSPDGEKIAYLEIADARSGSKYLRIQQIDEDGLRYVTGEGACQSRYSWSPDSQQIAFDSLHNGKSSDIYNKMVVAADENVLINLTNTDDMDEYAPEWSPNGDAILFTGVVGIENKHDVLQDIYLFDMNMGKIIQLTDDSEAYKTNFVWSPNGEYIAFLSTDVKTQSHWNMEVMDADGGDRRVIVSWITE